MRLIGILMLALGISCSDTNPEKKALVILLDGIPIDVIKRVNTPNIDEIAGEGVFTEAFVGGRKGSYTESPTISAVGYNSMLTGTWSNKHNVWGNGIRNPNYNYHSFFRIASLEKPSLSTAIFSTWLDNRTKLIGENLESNGDFKLDYAFDGFELDTLSFPHDKDKRYIRDIDHHVTDNASVQLLENGYALSWVYLEYPDDIGHRHGDGSVFDQSVREADLQIGKIWNAVQERMRQFNEDWLIVVTTDHGRTTIDGKGHGGQSTRERAIWIAMNKKSEAGRKGVSIVDIAPTILDHLEIQIPEDQRMEFDGNSLLRKESIANVSFKAKGNHVSVLWETKSTNPVEIYLSESNAFKHGGKDNFQRIDKVPNAVERFEFHLEDESKFYKLVLKSGDQYFNYWIQPDKNSK